MSSLLIIDDEEPIAWALRQVRRDLGALSPKAPSTRLDGSAHLAGGDGQPLVVWRGEKPPNGECYGCTPGLMPGVDLEMASCTACHAVDKKIVGPAYKDIVAKRLHLAPTTVRTHLQRVRAKYAAAWTDAPGGARSEVAVKWREAVENALSGGVDATVDRTRVGFAFGILNEDRNGVAYLPGGLA